MVRDSLFEPVADFGYTLDCSIDYFLDAIQMAKLFAERVHMSSEKKNLRRPKQ
jgi:hypothetical protein